MSTNNKPKGKVGRPRSEKARKAVLCATRKLLAETASGLSIEAVARTARVGKPTIYRWWPALPDIVLEVLLTQADDEIPVAKNLPLPETLADFIHRSVDALNSGAGVHLRYLMAQAQTDEGFRERFREHFVRHRRQVLHDIFNQAKARGEMAPDQDTGLLVDMVFGAMWYRLLTDHAELDKSFADQLCASIVRLAE